MREKHVGIMAKCKTNFIFLIDFLLIIVVDLCRFFKHLRNVSLEGDLNKPNIEFTADGDLKSTELKIMNLRPSINSKNIVWEEVNKITSFLYLCYRQFLIFLFSLDWCLEVLGQNGTTGHSRYRLAG